MVSNADIQVAFQTKISTRNNLASCLEKTLEAKSDLKRAEMTLINNSDPKVLGSNDKARDAKIRELTEVHRESLDICEAEERRARLEFEIACDKVDCLIWQIRNSEGAQPGSPETTIDRIEALYSRR